MQDLPLRSDGPYNFRIQRMSDIHDHAAGRPDVPHRHAYYTVLWVKKGHGDHTIDFRTYPLEENAVFFVSPGQVHQVVTRSRPEGWVITFSKEFLQHNHISEDFITEINLFHHFDERPPVYLPATMTEKLAGVMELMEEAFQSSMTYKIAALSACLKLFLTYCANECTFHRADPESGNNGKHILKDFKQLVQDHFHHLHKVSDYADKMNITAKYLNQVVRSLIGQTAKEVIQEKIILNAKRELKYSEKSVKEIAYELGFEEPLYFSSFFKKCTGVSPTAFRAS